MAYVPIAEVIEYVGSEISGDQAFIAAAYAAVEDAVNDECGRAFDPTTGASLTRTYVPVDGSLLITHDFIDATNLTISNLGTSVSLSDVQLEPLDRLTWSGLTAPFCVIRRLNGSWRQQYDGQASVSVTSTRWGWPAVPPQVVEATKILTKDIVQLKGTRFGVAGFDAMGAVVRVRENPHVAMLLNRLRHPSKGGM